MGIFDTGIRPAVDAYLKAKGEEKRDYGDYWSASSAGYCMRKVMFERLGVPPVEERDPRLTRVFEAGHIFHEWLQRITKEAGLSMAQELELQDEDFMIRGHIDDLVLIDKHLILYDFKTQNSRAFSYKRPLSHYHKYQLGTYMYMVRRHPTFSRTAVSPLPELTEARILKMDKDTLRMTEDVLLWSPELEKEVVDYWVELDRYWVTKKIPPCTCADHEGGFMAREKFNPYFYNGEPCSLEYYAKWKKEQEDAVG